MRTRKKKKILMPKDIENKYKLAVDLVMHYGGNCWYH